MRLANDSPYGLSGAVFSADVGADAPFGGFKRSGLGRELGGAGLAEYRQTQTIKFHAG